MSLLERVRVFSLFAALVASAASARAQSTAPATDPRNDAKALYDQGAGAYREGRYARAIELFLAADALAPSAPLSYNVARAYEKLGDSAKALRYYRDFVRRTPPSAEANEAREAVAKLELRLLERGVQQVTVRSEPNAELSIDGRPLGSTPWTGELAPGAHRLVLTRAGFVAIARPFELSKEHALDVDVRLEPSSAGVATTHGSNTTNGSNATRVAPRGPERPKPASDGAASGFGPWPWVTLGVGGVTLAAAGAFELSRRSAEADAREPDVDQIEYADRLDAAHDRQTAARVLLGVGAGLVAVGATLVVVDLGNDSDRRRVAVSCAPGACVGRFEVRLK